MTDRQMQTRVQRAIDSRLSGLAFDPLLARRAMAAARARRAPVLPRRGLSVLLALALLTALTVTAAASGAFGSVFAWLRSERPGAAGLGSMTDADAPFGEVTVGGVRFICTEAVADDRTFLFSVVAEGAEGCVLEADAVYRGHTAEMRREAVDGSRASIVGEGAHRGDPGGPMTLTLSVTRGSETATGALAVTPRVARAVEDRTLAAPVPLGDTGYALSALTLHRTELRTYLDSGLSAGQPPLSVALKRPVLVLIGPDGAELARWWPYGEPMPDPIRAQLWDGDRTELLCEITLTGENWKEVTP